MGSKKPDKPTRHDWNSLRKEWLSGKYQTLREMADAKKISQSTFKKRAAKEGWSDRRAEAREKADAIVEERLPKLIADRHLEMLEKQLSYSKVLVALGFANFKGKKRIARESDALRSISIGMDAQVRALKELRERDAEPPADNGPEVNVNVNIANVGGQMQDWSTQALTARLAQIAEEKKRISEDPEKNSGGADGK
jgi:hypothetical protein